MLFSEQTLSFHFSKLYLMFQLKFVILWQKSFVDGMFYVASVSVCELFRLEK